MMTIMYGSMERFDQGHLHPKLEVPGLAFPGRESNPGLHGEPFEQLVNSYSEHLHSTYEPAIWRPQYMCYMNIHEHT